MPESASLVTFTKVMAPWTMPLRQQTTSAQNSALRNLNGRVVYDILLKGAELTDLVSNPFSPLLEWLSGIFSPLG